MPADSVAAGPSPFVTSLEISLAWTRPGPRLGAATLGTHRGGRSVLLGWLETQLGLRREPTPLFERVAAFAHALERTPGHSFEASLGRDRWATASALLERWDELRLAGWDGSDGDALPPLVRDLARTVAAAPGIPPGEGERLDVVVAALGRGQLLPPHRCVLQERLDSWPRQWRSVLQRLTLGPAVAASPQAPTGSALAAVQGQLLGAELTTVTPDESLRWVRARSAHAACQHLVAVLASWDGPLEQVTLCCEDRLAAALLDELLSRAGLPTMGAAGNARAHPALQVLPLALRLCWSPVDPQLLLDFLLLPLCPLTRPVGRDLAAAVAERPGLGSSKWEEALATVTDPERDPQGENARRVADWLTVERVPIGSALPAALVRERCELVARWARRRAMGDEDLPQGVADMLVAAERQAHRLASLAEALVGGLTEPQLARLLEAVSAGEETLALAPEQEGAPRLAADLAEIAWPCELLVWLGLSRDSEPRRPWSSGQLAALVRAGLEVDDGRRGLAARLDAERRAVCEVSRALLAVSTPADESTSAHPVWLQIRTSFGKPEPVVSLEGTFTADVARDLAPFVPGTAVREIQAPHGERPRWNLPHDLLEQRESVSASSLETQLACPLKWVLSYPARLKGAQASRLPDEGRMRGTFAHAVLEAVLPCGQALPPPDEIARAVGEEFDRRLPLDAAPLSLPAHRAKAAAMRDEVVKSSRVLVEALREGGYALVGLECELTGKALGRQLSGRIDCLARRDDGEEAVVDFKYRYASIFRGKLKEGRAVQLATYAKARAGPGGRFPKVAYLMLDAGLLLVPEPSAPRFGQEHVERVDGPGIEGTWADFARALEGADAWLSGGEEVPARPLLPPEEWPEGTSLVVEVKNGERFPCKLCELAALCGYEERL